MSFKKGLALLLIGFVAVLLQTTVFRSWGGVFATAPNISLALVLFLAFYEASPVGAFLAFFLGLQVDLFSGLLLGPSAASFVLIYGLIACFAQRIFVESKISVFVAAFFGSLIMSLVYVALTIGSSRGFSELWLGILGEALLTALLAPFIFLGIRSFVYRRDASTYRY